MEPIDLILVNYNWSQLCNLYPNNLNHELNIRSIAPKKLSAQKEAALRRQKLVDNKPRKKGK